MGPRTTRDHRAVLQRMAVPGQERVFVLGCRARRVTVLSQQYRAFNLIWALFAAGLLRKGDRVGIIGGGIGGLTAAAAALLKGCSVVVAEAHTQLMHLQRGNRTRLLHPNIYDWPAARAEEDSTRLPAMNWTADLAGEVVLRLDAQWEDLVRGRPADVARDTPVSDIAPTGSGGRVVLVADAWRSEPCDVAVVAVGFGTEQSVPGVNLPLYWQMEHFGQAVPYPGGLRTRPKEVLISGLGDGGLIDVLRHKYENFDHGKFAAAVMRVPELARYKRRLLRIERRIPPDRPEEYLRDA
jgi:NADPH-dependent 2,4-dienoyl-CoA reductase/sulfur reductase-like enzyme